MSVHRSRPSRRAFLSAGVVAAATPAAAAALGGCAVGGSPPPAAQAEVKLRYLVWLKEWGEGIGPLAGRLREQRKVTLDVELANVGVTPWQEKLQTLFAADSAPDVIQGRANVDPLFQDGGMFMALTSHVQR